MLATLKKWIGKIVDYDKAYGYQCVDFARQHAKDMWNPIWTFWGSALNGWLTGSPFVWTKWERVTNTTTAIPKEWDIVFLDKTASNPYWHVAIAWEGCTGSKLVLIEQNAGNGNGDGKNGNKITMRTIKYNDPKRGVCLGWYTLKTRSELQSDNTTQSKFYGVYEKERPTNYTPIFLEHDDPTPATIGDIKYLLEIANIRKK